MLYMKYIYMYVICSCTCVCDEQYLMIIITLHRIEKSSNNISPIYLNKSTDNSSSTRHPNRDVSYSMLLLLVVFGVIIFFFYFIIGQSNENWRTCTVSFFLAFFLFRINIYIYTNIYKTTQYIGLYI